MSLLARLVPERPTQVEARSIGSVFDELFQWISYPGGMFPLGLTTTLQGKEERIENSFIGYVQGAYKKGGVVLAVIQARLIAFGLLRYGLQEFDEDGRPGAFVNPEGSLDILRRPWRGATTQDLNARMELYGSLAGNAFIRRRPGEDRLRFLRPDRTTIVYGSENADFDPDDPEDILDADLLGYGYQPKPGGKVLFIPAEEVAHYAPLPDPEAEYRGMSWLTPVLRNIMGHNAATEHKLRFFTNGATPNLLVKWAPSMSAKDAEEWKKLFLEEHRGVANAYKTLFLGGGADATPIGQSFQQLDFKQIQGADETIISAAGGVPPIIANLSEGIAAATYSNYGQAKKHFADTLIYYLGEQAAGSLETIVPPPANHRLWPDTRDIPFFRDDAKSEAETHQIEAGVMRNLIDGGFTPESAVAAVTANGDWTKLEHTGKLSVQLQDPSGSPAGDESSSASTPSEAPPLSGGPESPDRRSGAPDQERVQA